MPKKTVSGITDRSVPWVAIAIIAYLVGAFLTGGYYANHRCAGSYTCGMEAAYAGAAWPIYWGARAGIEVTK